MSPAVLAALAGLGAALAFVWWIHLRRELPVRGRFVAALLRTGTLAVLVLLLLDPELPGTSSSRSRVVVDRSPSMRVATPTEGAVDPALEVTLDSGVPDDSRVTERVARAIESGATAVRVVTDGRLADAVELRALLDRAPVDFEVVDVGGPVVNVGIEELVPPPAVRAGTEVPVALTVVHEGLQAPAEFELLLGDVVVATATIEPVGGARRRIELRPTLSAPDAAGPAHLRARVRAVGDGFPADDVRSALLEVDPDRGAVVLVSSDPGWEARMLLSTLGDVAGLPVRGYLRAPTPEGVRFLRTGEAPRLVDPDEVRAAVEDAAVVVRHGVPAVDSLVERAVEGASRRLRIGTEAAGSASLGEWYVAGELPASPLTAELAGIRLLGLPPLRWASEEDPGSPAGSPLAIRRDGTGDPAPALRFRETPTEREVEVLATGWWRWALRPGEPATLYRRLWSGVAGWLLAGGPDPSRTGIAPREGVSHPETPIVWDAPAAAGAALALEWSRVDGTVSPEDGDGAVRIDSVAVDPLGRGTSAPLPEGRWRWTATVVGGEADGRTRDGLVIREAWTGDLLLPRAEGLDARASAAEDTREAGRPLRGSPVPWLLLVGLLSAEWIVRRRTGLR